jgi:hypothetical protein
VRGLTGRERIVVSTCECVFHIFMFSFVAFGFGINANEHCGGYRFACIYLAGLG